MPHYMYLISHFTNCDSISISYYSSFLHTSRSPRMGINYLDRHGNPRMQLAFSNSSVSTPAANVITRLSHYTFTHVSTVNYLLNAGFFCKLLYNCERFPRITRSCNRETFPPWIICVIWYVPTTEYRYDKKHWYAKQKHLARI